MSHLPYERPPIRPCPPLPPLLGIGALVALGCKEPAELPKREPPTVRVSQPLAQTVTTYLEETGTTEAVQRADVRARVTGFLEQVKFEAGAEVAAGDELYVIEPAPFVAARMAAEADLEAMKVALTQAQIEYDRQLKLQQRNATSDTEIVAAEAKRDGAEAAVKVSEAALDQAKIEEDYTSVKAPISGRIGKTLVKQGNLVEKAGATLLTTIVNYDNIYANFNISERDLLTLMNRPREDGQKRDLKSVQVLLSRATDSGFPFQGHLDYADLAVDESTGTYAVRAVFPNPNEQILPGLFVRIRVVGRQKDVLMVPETAIRADQAGRHLWSLAARTSSSGGTSIWVSSGAGTDSRRN